MYYQALAQTVGGPLLNTAVWSPNPTVTPRYIPWWETGRTPIGAAFGAWTGNPFENPNRRRIDYLLSVRGIEFTATSSRFRLILFSDLLASVATNGPRPHANIGDA